MYLLQEKLSSNTPENDFKILPNCPTLFGGGISNLMSEKGLKRRFLQYGPVTKVEIKKGKEFNSNLGFAFISFANEEVLEKAIQGEEQIVSF